MKRFVVLSAVLAVLPFSSLSAQLPAVPQYPAIEELRASVLPAALEFTFPEPVAAKAKAANIPANLSGEQLFQYLHINIVPANRASSGYSVAKAYMYSKADNVTCNGGPGIITFYSEVCVNGTSANGNDYIEKGDQDKDGVAGDFVNAEHIWPQSYFNSAYPMVADLHQLASSFSSPNGRRANLRFAKVSNATYSTSSGSKLGKEGFEPADAVKGNVARAMLYFVVCYYDLDISQGMNYNDFWTSRVPMLLEWNRQDPPDANELRRNDLVETFQGNRNPFVDDPSLADRVGAAVFASH
ncbi:MAG: endonuclease [Elusimicrobia bacterium]|nr:endonuclease [Elusimicrobiota bacterium]